MWRHQRTKSPQPDAELQGEARGDAAGDAHAGDGGDELVVDVADDLAGRGGAVVEEDDVEEGVVGAAGPDGAVADAAFEQRRAIADRGCARRR